MGIRKHVAEGNQRPLPSTKGAQMDGGLIGDPQEVGLDRAGLERAIDLLEGQRVEGLHNGAQLFVAHRGRPVVDAAIGEVVPGVPLRTDSVMLWFSSGKPLTAVAIAQQVERGRLAFDDRIQEYIPEFANGKESATVRHVLTHTAGFPMAAFPFGQYDWDEMIQRICEAPAEWAPGTEAGYHPVSGWCILGEIVRRLDGRPIEIYLHDEVFKPLGMKNTTLGMPEARATELGDRLSAVTAKSDEPAAVVLAGSDNPEYRRRVLPGSSSYGPAHDLGRFYLALWNGGEWQGARILERETVDLITATHRQGMTDSTRTASLGAEVRTPWGLGLMKGGNAEDLNSIRYGRLSTSAAYGHGGALSSIGFVEPSRDLVVVTVANGLVSEADNNRRLRDVSDLIHTACRNR